MYGYVYLTRNKLNGKMYVGQKKATVYDLSYYGSGKILKRGLEKYGAESFERHILYEADSREELDAAEVEFIALYRKAFGDLMVNIADGGCHIPNKDLSQPVEVEFHGETLHFSGVGTFIKYLKKEFDYSPTHGIIYRLLSGEPYVPTRKGKQERIAGMTARLADGSTLHHRKEKNGHSITMIFNGETRHFSGLTEFRQYLTTELEYYPGEPTIQRILALGAEGKPFRAYRCKKADGMIAYYDNKKYAPKYSPYKHQNAKSVRLTVGTEQKDFQSHKALSDYLKETFDYAPRMQTIAKRARKGKPYKVKGRELVLTVRDL